MARIPRWVPPNSLVEISCRCIQGRFLLRPCKALNAIFVGVLLMALRATGIKVHCEVCQSNHWHILATVPSNARDFLLCAPCSGRGCSGLNTVLDSEEADDFKV